MLHTFVFCCALLYPAVFEIIPLCRTPDQKIPPDTSVFCVSGKFAELLGLVFATESFPLDNHCHEKSENGLAFGFNVGTVTEGVITEILGILIGEAKTTFIIGSLGCDMLGKFIFGDCLFIDLAFIPAFIMIVLISS